MAGQSAEQLRKRDLAIIHMARNELGMDDDIYRAMLFTIARVRSAADLDWSGRKRVIDHLKARGWKKRSARKSRHADDPLSRKIIALWLELRDQGAIDNASDQALQAYLKRQTGVQALEWLSNKQAHAVIEALKSWLDRTGKQS